MFSLVPVASWGGDAVLPDVVLPSFVASDSDGNIPVAPVLVVPVVKKKQKLRLSQLDVARFIASVHIVVGHLDSRGDGLVSLYIHGYTYIHTYIHTYTHIYMIMHSHYCSKNKQNII